VRDSYIALQTGCQQIVTDLNRIKRYTLRLAPLALYNTATGDQWPRSRSIAMVCRPTSGLGARFTSVSNPDTCAQATLLRTLGIDCPRSITFNDVSALHACAGDLQWPSLLKPDQGGSGARIQVVESLAQIEDIFRRDPDVWLPDNLFLLQELLPHDPERGIVRLEFVGGELLYAMRVIAHGAFNLCPSEVCNPETGESRCEVTAVQASRPVEFHPLFRSVLVIWHIEALGRALPRPKLILYVPFIRAQFVGTF